MERKTTVLHDEIREWIGKNNGIPAILHMEASPDATGLLRIKFGVAFYGDSGPGQELEPISWQEFFDRFESDRLAFSYSDNVVAGQEEDSFNFVARGVEDSSKDDMTELPEDNEMAKENMFPTEEEV